MEPSLYIFNALSPVTLTILATLIVILGTVIVTFTLHDYRRYAKELAEYNKDLRRYEAAVSDGTDNASSELVKKPNRPDAASMEPLGAFVVIVFVCLLIGSVLMSLSITSLESAHTHSKRILEESKELNVAVQPEVAEIIDEWTSIVEYQKQHGDTDKYDDQISEVYLLVGSGISGTEKYALAEKMITLCFDDNIKGSDLERLFDFYPVHGKLFAQYWKDAAYEHRYKKTLLCKPENVFKNVGISARYY